MISEITFNIGEEFKRQLRKVYGIKVVVIARKCGPNDIRKLLRKRKHLK